MPIYTYHCSNCNMTFDEYMFKDIPEVFCPECVQIAEKVTVYNINSPSLKAKVVGSFMPDDKECT